MGFRFRKSISICPGIRVNFGKSGFTGVNVGPRGASLSIGKQGTHANVGLPGTGLSYRTRIGRTNAEKNNSASSESQNTELAQQLNEIESEIRDVLNIHLQTPNVQLGKSLEQLKKEYLISASMPFSLNEPIRPVKPVPPPKPELKTSWFGKFIIRNSDSRELELQENIRRWEIQNAKDTSNYVQMRTAWASEYANWKKQKEIHNLAIKNSENSLSEQFESNNNFFEEQLGLALNKTTWPRETNICFEVDAKNSLIKLDVDLPEIEDMPCVNYRLNKKGSEILEKDKTAKQIRLEYAMLIHGIIFRLAGIALYHLPFKCVEISGFTQRLNQSTGYVVDDYIIKSIVDRGFFSNINFKQLELLNPIEALEKCELKRNMTATGIFKKLSTI